MLNLYHGTSAPVSDCEDLVSGYDGMIHFALTRDSARDFVSSKNTPRNISHYDVVRCQADLDMNALPEVRDMGYWSPFKLAQEFRDEGIINDDELLRVYSHSDGDSRAVRLEPARLREDYSDSRQSDPAYPPGIPLRDILEEEAGDEEIGGWAKDTLGLLDRNDAAQRELFSILESRGINAFKYKNTGDLSQRDQWAVAVIDPQVLSKPEKVSSGRWEHPDLDLVTDAVDDYRRSRVVMQHSATPMRNLEYRSMKEPAYSGRSGRGRLMS